MDSGISFKSRSVPTPALFTSTVMGDIPAAWVQTSLNTVNAGDIQRQGMSVSASLFYHFHLFQPAFLPALRKQAP